MFITTDQLVVHIIGDYILQSEWMASHKTKSSVAALVHVIMYTIPWLVLTASLKTILFIAVTHFVIDRFRLARYICWVKNFMAPKWIPISGYNGTSRFIRNKSWRLCTDTGYGPEKPVWMSVWLMIITDNVMHIILNAFAVKFL